MAECRNCGESTSTAYTLLVESGLRLDDVELCQSCQRFFSDGGHIEVRETPVLVRGGGGGEE